jgi:hypothetical protein
MFSIDVVGQDAFLDMATDSRELYFQLGMYADDEGFVSPKKVMRVVGAPLDALKALIEKGYARPFKSGVILITHWNQNNYIQNDRFTPTTFKEEKAEMKQLRIQDVYNLDTQGGREVSKKERTILDRENPELTPEERAAKLTLVRANLNRAKKL